MTRVNEIKENRNFDPIYDNDVLVIQISPPIFNVKNRKLCIELN